jgi:K+-transporting ATPase KdpF subunit
MFCSPRRALSPWPSRSAASSGCEGPVVETVLGLAVALALFVYLVAALLRPERF